LNVNEHAEGIDCLACMIGGATGWCVLGFDVGLKKWQRESSSKNEMREIPQTNW